MPLASIDDLMRRCQQGRYAVGYFESWNLESLQGVLDAAEQTRSPVIIGFNGEFLSHSYRQVAEPLTLYGALGKAAAESSSVPCGLIFNECPDDERILAAASAGFNLVMPADPHAAYEDSVRRLRSIVRYCHERQVEVEGELGELPCDAAGHGTSGGMLTDPVLAERFVAETSVDLLAVSVGNVHIALDGAHELDCDRLAAIRHRARIPLVLHGGTGIAAGSLKAAIRLGVAKVNYGTYIKQRCLAALRQALATDDINPHHLLGYGGDADLMIVVRRAVRDAVLERIGDLGCCGKA